MPKQKPEETREALIEKRKKHKPKSKPKPGKGSWAALYELLATQPSLGFEETNRELGRRGFLNISSEDYYLRYALMRYIAYSMVNEDYNLRLANAQVFDEMLAQPIEDFGETFLAMFTNVIVQNHRFSTIDAVNMLIEDYGLLPPTDELEEMLPIRLILRECFKAIHTHLDTGIPEEIWETILSLPQDDIDLARKQNVGT